MTTPCERQGHHIFLPGELGILRPGDSCTCGGARWMPEPVLPLPAIKKHLISPLATAHGWSQDQIVRNRDAAELLALAVPTSAWEEDFLANLTRWIDTHRPVTEKQITRLRRLMNHDYQHYTDTEGYF